MAKCEKCGAEFYETRKKPLKTCPRCRAKYGSAAQRAKKRAFTLKGVR